MLSDSKCPQRWCAAAWLEPSHGSSRGHAFLWEICNTTLLHHKALRFQHIQGTRSAFMVDLPMCTSPTHAEYIRINVYVHYDYVWHFPVDLALQITFKTNELDTDKAFRYSKWLLRLTFACFWLTTFLNSLESISQWAYKARTFSCLQYIRWEGDKTANW